MKAPIYAYVVGEDNNFLKVVTRDTSGVYRIFVARFLRGPRSEGGYSESSADMIDDIKALFRLDDLLLVRQKQSDGGMKVMGFVGMVRTDGPWAEYHNMDKRSAGVAAGDTDGAGDATVTINGLHVRQSQTGPSMEGQFTTGTGAMVTFPQTMTYGGRYQIILVFILTTRLTSFWVTADAVCSNSKYKFSNPGGQSGSGGSVVVPTT